MESENTELYSGDTINKNEAEWSEELTPDEFHVLREKGTERAFTGLLYENHSDGIYKCKACGLPLFDSVDKFDSGSGWPSFIRPLHLDGDKNRVEERRDLTHGMVRTEVVCARCKSHLGHVFEDGPKPTGLRFCINSISLAFEEKNKE